MDLKTGVLIVVTLITLNYLIYSGLWAVINSLVFNTGISAWALGLATFLVMGFIFNKQAVEYKA